MNKYLSLVAFAIVICAVLGCGKLTESAQKSAAGESNLNANSANSNKSLTDRAIETAVGDDKVGIPECDEVITILAAQTNNPDDNVITKALKLTALNRFRAEVRKGLEEHKANRADTVKFCKDFKSSLESNTNTNAKAK